MFYLMFYYIIKMLFFLDFCYFLKFVYFYLIIYCNALLCLFSYFIYF